MGSDSPARTRERDVWSLAILVALVTLIACPVLVHGAPVAAALATWGFQLAFVALPGWVAYRALRPPGEDALLGAGMAWTLGYCLATLAYIGAKIAGLDAWFALYPAVVLVIAFATRRRTSGASAVDSRAATTPSARELWPLALLLLLVVCRTPFHASADWWRTMSDDLLFHAGNAAELRNHWPMQDPRVAGEPLAYHFFAYALPASASAVTGLAVRELMYGVGAYVGPTLLAVQVYNAGKLYGGSALAGLVASALVLLHTDYGRAIAFVLDQLGLVTDSRWRAGFNSYLDLGIFSSASTSFGLMLFATLAILLHRWFASPARRSARDVAWLAVTGFVASGAKGSIMPVLLAGLGALCVWSALRRAPVRATFGALCVLAAVSLPMTLWLALGEHNYASGMFRVDPLSCVRQSQVIVDAMARRGLDAATASAGWMALAAPIWIVGYLDLIGIGAFVYALRHRTHMELGAQALSWSGVAGTALALAYAAPDASQLFFLYTGQIGLAVLAGAGFAELFRARGLGRWVALALLVPCALPPVALVLAETWRELRRPTPEATPNARAYERALDWIRTAIPRDAVIVTARPGISISALAERRAFYETDRFTAQSYALNWISENGHWKFAWTPDRTQPERKELRKRCYSPRAGEAIDEIEQRLGGGAPLYVLYDDVRESWTVPEPPTETESVSADAGTNPRRPKGNRHKVGPDKSKSRHLGSGARGDYLDVSAIAPPVRPAGAERWEPAFTNEVMHVVRVDAGALQSDAK